MDIGSQLTFVDRQTRVAADASAHACKRNPPLVLIEEWRRLGPIGKQHERRHSEKHRWDTLQECDHWSSSSYLNSGRTSMINRSLQFDTDVFAC